MLTVSLLVLDGTWGAQLMTLLDLLALYQRVAGNHEPRLQVGLHGITTRATLANGIVLPVSPLPPTTSANTLVMIPGVEYPTLRQQLGQLAEHQPLRQHLLAANNILCLSTGSFVPAELGLIAQGAALTHWRFASHFARRYPHLTLAKQDWVENGRVHCTCQLSAAVYWLGLQLQQLGHPDAVQQAMALSLFAPAQTDSLWLADTFACKQHADTTILRLQHDIDHHFAETVPLADLAARVHLSPSSLKRRFKLASGVSVSSYLQMVRLARMKYLLLSTRLNVDSIAQAVGYADPRSARRLFRRETGYTPGQYRESLDRAR